MKCLPRAMLFFTIVFFILGLALIGEAKISSQGTGICLKVSSSKNPIVVSSVKQILHRYYKPCIAVPPLCTRYKMIYATEYHTEYVIKNETTPVCCDGFQEQNERCEPICADICGVGVCSAPGTCSCHDGWTGPKCSTPICNKDCGHGKCSSPDICTCNEGWLGNTCNIPVCSKDCGHGNCSSPDVCTCNEGWLGNSCNVPICNEDCGHGKCSSPDVCTCNEGWLGNNCSVPICNQDCGQGRCSYPDICVCNEGWLGNSCNIPLCTVACDHGVCTSPDTCTCENGWFGKICNESKESCPKGHYGFRCSLKCDCENSDGCDPASGHCYCLDGFKGIRCTEPCPTGTHGPKCGKKCSCENGGTCSHVDGTCECSEGFIGAHCQNKCQAGFYGHKCAKECFCNKSTSECDHRNGSCKCLEGWIGETCDQRNMSNEGDLQCDNAPCEVNCKAKTCNMETGECVCEPEGYRTSSSNLSAISKDNRSVGVVVGSSVAVLGIIITVVLLIFVIHRRKKKRSAPKEISEVNESLFPGRTSKMESETHALKDSWNVSKRGKNIYEKAKRESLAEMMARESPSTYFVESENIYEDIVYKEVNLHPEDNVYENDDVVCNTQHNPTYGAPILPRKNEDATDLHESVECLDHPKSEDRSFAEEAYDVPKSSSLTIENVDSEA